MRNNINGEEPLTTVSPTVSKFLEILLETILEGSTFVF
jgi:hypothetical protein